MRGVYYKEIPRLNDPVARFFRFFSRRVVRAWALLILVYVFFISAMALLAFCWPLSYSIPVLSSRISEDTLHLRVSSRFQLFLPKQHARVFLEDLDGQSHEIPETTEIVSRSSMQGEIIIRVPYDPKLPRMIGKVRVESVYAADILDDTQIEQYIKTTLRGKLNLN